MVYNSHACSYYCSIFPCSNMKESFSHKQFIKPSYCWSQATLNLHKITTTKNVCALSLFSFLHPPPRTCNPNLLLSPLLQVYIGCSTGFPHQNSMSLREWTKSLKRAGGLHCLQGCEGIVWGTNDVGVYSFTGPSKENGEGALLGTWAGGYSKSGVWHLTKSSP